VVGIAVGIAQSSGRNVFENVWTEEEQHVVQLLACSASRFHYVFEFLQTNAFFIRAAVGFNPSIMAVLPNFANDISLYDLPAVAQSLCTQLDSIHAQTRKEALRSIHRLALYSTANIRGFVGKIISLLTDNDWEVRLHVPDTVAALAESAAPHLADIEALGRSQLPGVRSQVEKTLELLDDIPGASEALLRVMALDALAIDMELSLQAELPAADALAAPANARAHDHILRTLCMSQQDTATARAPESIWILRFGSAPSGADGLRRLREELLSGQHMRSCRDNLAAAGFSCCLPNEALIFVDPQQYALAHQRLASEELRHFNVVVSDSFERMLFTVLGKFSFQMRPKLKPGDVGRRPLDVGIAEAVQHTMQTSRFVDVLAAEDVASLEDMEMISGEHIYELQVTRTFLSYERVPKASQSVAQSTTEAYHPESTTHYSSFRGKNPRRLGDSNC